MDARRSVGRLTAVGRPLSAIAIARAAGVLAVVVAGFCTVFALCRFCGAATQPAILAGVIGLSIARRARPADRFDRFAAPLASAAIALTAVAVGNLLRTVPIAGAAVFTALLSASVWLRGFGRHAARIGALIALPLVAILVAPGRAAAPGGPAVDLGLLLAAGAVPVLYAGALAALLARCGIAPPPERLQESVPRSTPSGTLSVPARMALQMGVALGAAFAVGFTVFPGHWTWTVLTAFIVCSGARGRGDALYRGVLRVAGAGAGTLAATLIARTWSPAGPLEAGLIFAVLFAGIVLRDVNYAYWAGCITIVFALLSPAGSGAASTLLGLRLAAIVCGALVAAAATWFVAPITTEAVVRRRLADALRAFDAVVAGLPNEDGPAGHVPPTPLSDFEHRLTELEGVAAPVRWHRRLFAAADAADHPAAWIDRAVPLRDHARRIAASPAPAERRSAVRRAIGNSRRAIAGHGKSSTDTGTLRISTALDELHRTLAAADTHAVPTE